MYTLKLSVPIYFNNGLIQWRNPSAFFSLVLHAFCNFTLQSRKLTSRITQVNFEFSYTAE